MKRLEPGSKPLKNCSMPSGWHLHDFTAHLHLPGSVRHRRVAPTTSQISTKRSIVLGHPLLLDRGLHIHLVFLCILRQERIMGIGPSTPLQQCLNTVCNGRTGCVAYPGQPFYQLFWVKSYNKAIDITPVAVIRPNNANEVAEAVKCAVREKIYVQARSGGHSYGYVFGVDTRAHKPHITQYSLC